MSIIANPTHASSPQRARASDGSDPSAPSALASGRKALSKPKESAVGIAAGLVAAATTQLIRGTDGGVALAPPASQAAITTGATIAAFSQMSSLRSLGGDPCNYGTWRSAGLGAAVAIPLVDRLLASSAELGAIDPALTYRWPAMSLLALNAGLGGFLQKLLDERPLGPDQARQLLLAQRVAGAAFLASVACHAGLLLAYASTAAAEFKQQADLDSARSLETLHPAVLYGAALCLTGASSGWVARRHLHNESVRVAGFTLALAGIAMALWGASQSRFRQ